MYFQVDSYSIVEIVLIENIFPFQKLYELLTPDVLHVKYRARFFHLADRFLMSTHLPEYLVAAFVKRLSRIALTGPSNALLMVLPFIGIITKYIKYFSGAVSVKDPNIARNNYLIDRQVI